MYLEYIIKIFISKIKVKTIVHRTVILLPSIYNQVSYIENST